MLLMNYLVQEGLVFRVVVVKEDDDQIVQPFDQNIQHWTGNLKS